MGTENNHGDVIVCLIIQNNNKNITIIYTTRSTYGIHLKRNHSMYNYI